MTRIRGVSAAVETASCWRRMARIELRSVLPEAVAPAPAL